MARRSAWRALPRPVRIGVWSLATLLGLLVVAGIVIALSFDPDSLKPRVEAAVKQQTGRDLALQGRIRLGLSLQPTLVVQGVSLANPPGFSRPQMATLERLELRLALIPLLSNLVEVNRLVLVKPDILLETDAQGRPNWLFAPPAGAATPRQADASGAERSHMRIDIAEVRIEDGTVALRDARTGKSTVLGITSLRMTSSAPGAPLKLAASVTYNGAPFTLAGDTGALDRLQGIGATTPWPVQVTLEAGGAKLALDGTVAQPMLGRGYAVKVTAAIPDLAALAPFLPGIALPPLHDVSLAAALADSGATLPQGSALTLPQGSALTLPQISALSLRVGQSDLTAMVAGMRLDSLDVSAERMDQPAHLAAKGSFANAPLSLAGSLGAPAALLSGGKPSGPIPLDLHIEALGSSLSVKGTAAQGQDGRPSVQAEVTADKIDLDALQAALGKSPAQVPTQVPGDTTPPARQAGSGRMIPDTPIPFDRLRLADADMRLNVAQLVAGGATYRAIATHLDLRGGRLRLDPVAVDMPEGHVDGTFSADATQPAPTVALKLRIPALALQPLLAAIGKPAFISGNLQVQADLRGAGASPHAIAASLDGSLGLALANGTMDNRLLGSTLGSILREASMLDLAGRGGNSQVQCFVARFDANHGVAALRSLVFVSSLLTMDGDGSLNLGAETLDLHLRPQAKLAGTGLVVPVRVAGSFRSPSTTPDPSAVLTQNAGTVASALLFKTTPLGFAAGALGGQKLLGGGGPECGAAPAAARGQAAAPDAPPQPRSPEPKPSGVGGALKQLFR